MNKLIKKCKKLNKTAKQNLRKSKNFSFSFKCSLTVNQGSRVLFYFRNPKPPKSQYHLFIVLYINVIKAFDSLEMQFSNLLLMSL